MYHLRKKVVRCYLSQKFSRRTNHREACSLCYWQAKLIGTVIFRSPWHARKEEMERKGKHDVQENYYYLEHHGTSSLYVEGESETVVGLGL